jgi:alpha-tubulin suppressor-like RCC1 family protein
VTSSWFHAWLPSRRLVMPARQVLAVTGKFHGTAAGLEFGLALRSDGIAFTWGHGQDGQLGNGGTADSPVPVKVAGLTQVTGISVGWFASSRPGPTASRQSPRCGPGATASGELSDDNGQLGVVLTSSPATRPVNAIAAGSGIVQLAAGAEHMLALKSDGTVVAWPATWAGGVTAPFA